MRNTLQRSNRIVSNAAWLIGLQIAKSVIGLVVSMLTARYLGPANYGTINYAASIVAFVTPIMYLGLNGTLVHELVKRPEKEGEVLGTSICMCALSACLCVLGVISFSILANGNERDTVIVCALYSTLLLFQSVDIIAYWFQAKLLSKYHALASVAAYLCISAYRVVLLITGKSVYWFALSNALDYLILSALSVLIYSSIGGQRLKFSFSTARALFANSRYYIVSNLMVTIFAQTDKIMLKLMLDSYTAGIYSAAISCSGMTAFVFSAIIDSFRPEILGNKAQNQTGYMENLKLLYCVVIYLSLLQCIVLSVGSGLIVNLLFGSAYAAAAPVLAVVAWYTTFSYIGAIRNIWILAEGKHKYLWIINLSGAVANVVLNFALIPVWGAIGAAAASLITQIFTNIIIGQIIPALSDSNKIILASLNPKLIIHMVRKMRRTHRGKED